MQKIDELDYSNVPEFDRAYIRQITESCWRKGLIISPLEAYKAWDDYSDSMCAGFMSPPQTFDDGEEWGGRNQDECDNEIKEIVEYYILKNKN